MKINLNNDLFRERSKLTVGTKVTIVSSNHPTFGSNTKPLMGWAGEVDTVHYKYSEEYGDICIVVFPDTEPQLSEVIGIEDLSWL